ncbi:hypothetical protein D9M68_552660 [compost metagenome]
MSDWTLAELEDLLQVARRRGAIAVAHSARMRLPHRADRERARLSDFLPAEDVAWCWFIHDKAAVPICQGWPREQVSQPTHHLEVRRCWTEMVCTAWEPLPEVDSPTAGALTSYLTALYGEDPELHPVGFEGRMVEDKRGYQYRFVTMPTLRIPSHRDIETVADALLAARGAR